MKSQKGQALVLVLLSLAVVLTLVLFILSRSVTDISVSSSNADATRAFSAAEAGVEQALVIGTGTSSTQQFSANSASYTSSVTDLALGLSDYNYPLELSSGDSMTTWFTAHDKTTDNTVCDATHSCFTGNTLKICWGKSGTNPSYAVTPAIEISIFYETAPGDPSTVQIARAAFDPYAGRLASEGFSASDAGACTISGVNYAFQKTFQFSDLGILPGSYNVQNGLQFVRVRMFYNTDTQQTLGMSVAGFAGDSVFPSQGQEIVSTGTSGPASGQSTRKLNVFQSWPETPSVFDNSVFSNSSAGLTK